MNSLSAGSSISSLKSRNACQNIRLAPELCDLIEADFEDASERSSSARHLRSTFESARR